MRRLYCCVPLIQGVEEEAARRDKRATPMSAPNLVRGEGQEVNKDVCGCAPIVQRSGKVGGGKLKLRDR